VTGAVADACVYGMARRREHQQNNEGGGGGGGGGGQRGMDAQVIYAPRGPRAPEAQS
jgi:hypothetical protein